MENELATIAIKGGRYSEAEEIFNGELKQSPNYQSYFGLGICKLNMLLNVNRTVDEAIYCFEKSLNLIDEKNREELENQIFDYTSSILTQFNSLYAKLEEEKKKQANAAMLGAALTIGAAAIGSSKSSNAFTQIASLAAAGAGVGLSLDGLGKLGKIPEIQAYIVDSANQIVHKSKSYLKSGNNFKNLENLCSKLNELQTSTSQKEQANIDKTKLLLLALCGVHYFYLGENKKGILYLCSIGGCGIWFMMDIMKIVQGKSLA